MCTRREGDGRRTDQAGVEGASTLKTRRCASDRSRRSCCRRAPKAGVGASAGTAIEGVGGGGGRNGDVAGCTTGARRIVCLKRGESTRSTTYGPGETGGAEGGATAVSCRSEACPGVESGDDSVGETVRPTSVFSHSISWYLRQSVKLDKSAGAQQIDIGRDEARAVLDEAVGVVHASYPLQRHRRLVALRCTKHRH